jgi:hypothetical protein
MTKSEIKPRYDAVTKRTGNQMFLMLLATLAAIIVIPFVIYYFGASRHTGGVIAVGLLIVFLPMSLGYAVWFGERELTRSGLCCSSCQKPFDRRTMRTGKCWKCGERVFDNTPDEPRVVASISYKTLLWIFVIIVGIILAMVSLTIL